jgi:hypothetical protein
VYTLSDKIVVRGADIFANLRGRGQIIAGADFDRSDGSCIGSRSGH